MVNLAFKLTHLRVCACVYLFINVDRVGIERAAEQVKFN